MRQTQASSLTVAGRGHKSVHRLAPAWGKPISHVAFEVLAALARNLLNRGRGLMDLTPLLAKPAWVAIEMNLRFSDRVFVTRALGRSPPRERPLFGSSLGV